MGEAWRSAATQMDRPAVVRLLHALQDRLDREESSCKRAEARLGAQTAGTTPLGRPLSLSSLPLHEKAKAISAARGTGVWPKGAAGHRHPVRSLSVTAQPRPLRQTGPLFATPAPMATI